MNNFYRALYEIAKTLQFETRQSSLPQILLDTIIDATGADRGFIVVKEEGSFQEKYQLHFDRALVSSRERRFSRTLVREAIAANRIIVTDDITRDARFETAESVILMPPNSVLVAPLGYGGEVQAVIYMEKKAGTTPFGDDDEAFMSEVAQVAGAAFHRALHKERDKPNEDELVDYDFCGIVGRHPKMIHLLQMLVQVAKSDATVLINGETGSGKELVAKAIYRNSNRADKPYVTLHCGAMPETLFESELFGHKKGSFTGAHQDRAGRIAQANGGTLFLDEIAEIPLSTQAKLLRFIQFGEFQRVGSDHVETVDIRIIAATHKNLAKMVEADQFRSDLYFRLNVLELEIPSLRDRKSDVPLLMDTFLKRFWRHEDLPALSADALAALERYDYPGNVRELAHIVERLCVLARGPKLELDLLPKAIREPYRRGKTMTRSRKTDFVNYTNDELKSARERATHQAVAEVEQAFLEGLLKASDGNITKAAKTAEMQRPYLHRLIAKYRK